MASIGDVKATLTLDTSKFVAGINTAKKTTDSIRSVVGSVTSSIFNLKNAMVGAIGALGVNDIKNTAIAFQSLDVAMKAAAGGAEEGKAAMAFARSEADRLGLNLYDTSKMYKLFLASAREVGVTMEESQRIFTSVAEASAVLGLNTDDTRGVFRALEQMMSKGNVQAEELRGQLGERLPGALPIFAAAIGVTTKELNKMLEQGQVIAAETVPKMATALHNKFAKDVPSAAASARASMERFGNSITDLKLVIAESGLLEFITQLAKVATTGFKALGITIKETLSKSTNDAAKSTEDYTKSLISMVQIGGKAIGLLADSFYGLKLIAKGLEVAWYGFGTVIKKIFDPIQTFVENAINIAINGINKLIEGYNKLPFDDIAKLENFKFSRDLGKEANEYQLAFAKAAAEYIDMASSDKPSKDIKEFTDKFVSNIGKVTDEAKKAEEAVKNIAPTTATASAPIFTFNTQQFEDTIKTGVQSALTKGITDALTGKFDFQTFAQQMTTAVASAAAAGIVQGMALSTGGALALAGGAAVLGGIFGGGGGGKSRSDVWLERQTTILEQIRDNTDKLNEFDLTGTALQTGLSDLGEIVGRRLIEEVDTITNFGATSYYENLSAQDIANMTADELRAYFDTNIGSEGGYVGAVELFGADYISAAGDALSSFQDVIYAIGQASGDTTLQLQNATNALMSANIGFDGTAESYDAITDQVQSYNSTLFDLQQRMRQAVRDGDEFAQIQIASEIEAFTDANSDLLTGILDNYDAFQLLGDEFSTTTDAIGEMEDALNSVTASIASVGEMSRSTQQVIDSITAGMKAPAESVAFLQERRKQELAELETARANLEGLIPGTETYLQQLARVQQENQDFLTASQNASEAVKNTFGSSDVGMSEQQSILDDLRSQQEVNFTLEQQLMNEQISWLSKIEENTRPTSAGTPTTEGLTDEQIALVLKGLIEKYATQEAFD